ncbi:MAG: quinol:cytochrome C oxidoreductase [Planctomycetes bacterium]|nr:quinol:cytochrome C oxidoreductase [Planctomycetota bacterium]
MQPTNVVREAVMAPSLAAKTSRIGLVVGVLGMVLAVLLGLLEGDHMRHFYWAYLVAFSFVFTLTLGGLFFVLIQHVTGARWSVSVRRMGEFAMNTVPLLAVMALPLLYPLFTHAGVEEFGGLLWPWIHPHGEHAALVEFKSPFLNVGFFLARSTFYLLAWWIVTRFFLKKSVQQDQDQSEAHTVTMRKLSAPSIILFALTISFASFDWIMSTDPTWFSTIFGVYIFGGAFLAINALLVISAYYLRTRNVMTEQITTEHYHDLGKFMTAFTVFWAYIAFSQFMLIWYANIPEETVWFQHRVTEAWSPWSYGLVFTNFVIPFFGFLSRWTKRNPKVLMFWAAYTLVVHWVDIYWLIMPNMDAETVPFSLVEITTALGAFGFFVWAYSRQATKHSLLAYGDPNLERCLGHVNY